MEIVRDHILALVLMLGLLGCSAFFSSTETALFSLSREQIRRLRGHGRQVDRLLSTLAGNPSGLLIAILFGNLLVNVLFFSTGAVIALETGRRYGAWWEAAIGFCSLLLVVLVGEVLPKAAGISFPERIVRINSSLLEGWYALTGPVRRLLEYIARHFEPAAMHDEHLSADELRMLIDATRHDPTFGKQEKDLVEDIVNLPEIRLRELMVPRVDQLLLDAATPADRALREASAREVEWVPVYEGEEDNVVGIVDVRELFVAPDPRRPIGECARPVRFVPETKRADAMVREFMAENLHMVCVVDEYGGLAGTVCLEDLLEEAVGEFDALEMPPVEQLGETTYRLRGHLSIREWRSLFTGFLPDEVLRTLALDTLSGLVVSLLKRMPAAGDVVCVGNLRFTVETVRNNRIESILLELTGQEEGE